MILGLGNNENVDLSRVRDEGRVHDRVRIRVRREGQRLLLIWEFNFCDTAGYIFRKIKNIF